jgi:hypothetical protein
MPIESNNTTKSYVDTQKLRLPLTQFNDNQCPFDTSSGTCIMIAVALRRLAFLIILFCISPIHRRQIWTSTSKDQHFLGLRVPLCSGSTPFPSSRTNSHKTIRAEETIFCPHPLPIHPHLLTMHTNSYALAVLGGSSKTGRKASKISESPVRQASFPTGEWPAIGSDTTPGSLSRTQGATKKGKTSSVEGSQKKLNAFFVLANADKKKFNLPTLAIAKTGVQATNKHPTAIITTPSSPPNTKRLLTNSLRLDSEAEDKSPPLPSSRPTLALLGKTRAKSSTAPSPLTSSEGAKAISGKKADPPTTPTPVLTDFDTSDNSDMETELPTVKVFPKSSKSTKSATSVKRKSAKRLSVGFSPPDPKHVQLVEPEDVPPTPRVDHPYKTVLTATVRIKKVKDALSHFITKMTDTLAFLRTHVDPTMAILPKSADFNNEHIVDKLSFPTVVFLLNQRYFNVETKGAFMDTLRSHNGRTVKCWEK